MYEGETRFHKWGKMQKNEPNDFQNIFRIALVRQSQIFKSLIEKANKDQFGLQKYHWKYFKVYLKCPYIVHLELKCMNYDQKKSWDLNWEFYF